MKRNINNFGKYGILFLVFFLHSVCLFAYDFEAGGLCYNILPDNTVEVTYKSYNEHTYYGEINIPEIVTYNGVDYSVSAIGYAAFSGCTGLTGSLTIPQSVKSIASTAFYRCIGLSGPLTIPNSVTFIGNGAFQNCSGFTGELSIPGSVTVIEGYAFKGCSGFTGVLTIPNSVTAIGNFAFEGCSGLTGSLIIPNSISSIENGTFRDCSGFTGLLIIPNSITSIGEYAFTGCTGLTNLTIPNTVTSIGNYAFEKCSGIDQVRSEIENPFAIDKYVFSGISSSAKLHVPKGAQSKYLALSGWTKYFKEIVESVVTEDPSSIISFTDINVKALCVQNWDTNGDGELSDAEAATVTDLGEVFSFNKTITSFNELQFFTGLTNIGQNVFRECNSLTSIMIPNSVISIGKEAFEGCDKLQSIVLSSSITTIGAETFYNCQSLESINLPERISSIGSSAFWGCSNLKSINIPNSLSSIDDDVFLGCQSLTSIELPQSITAIGKYAFSGSGLINISLPNSIVSIGIEAFSLCRSLSSIVLPESLTSIGKNAFSGCSALKEVDSKITEPFDTYAFSGYFTGAPKDPVLYVPAGTKEKYLNCYGWKNFFKDIIEVEAPVATYSLSITATGNGSASYNGTTVRGKTSSFTVSEGTNATITFTPDAGYRIASVKVNNSTVSVSNNQYTVSNITANTTVAVTFEQIPPTYYDLTISATGNGSATYNSTNVRGKTQTFSVVEGTNATIKFTPDAGYRIASVKVNNSTVSVSNNQYTVSNITANTTVAVTFEQIPPTYYDLTISATGNGSATYNSTNVRGKSQTFSVVEGTNATITFAPDAGYRIASVKVNNATVTVSNNQYTVSNITANTTVAVTFEQIPPTYYDLTISATGNGSATYNSTNVRGKTQTFSVVEGTNATIKFTPDAGYKIASVKVNNATVTVSNNQYTVSNIAANTTVAVTFEQIPPTYYDLTISATGNGSATYNNTNVRGKSQTFSVVEGTNATITFTPDNGYRIKSVKVNNSTVSISSNQYTVSNISKNTTVSVEFEAIPPTTYTLSITATGSGSASYNGTTVRGKTSTFTVNEGANATITFTPDNGYRIKSVKVNNSTVSISGNQYTVSNISKNTTVAVEFEAIPITTYTLSITATGNGSASYNGTTVRGKTSSFTVNEGTNATITFTPDAGYRIASVKVNNATVSVYNNQYTVSNITANTTVAVTFEQIPPTYYDLTISATGNGSATYNSTNVRGKSQTFSVVEGTNATITFTPDNGYRTKSVKVNNSTVSISNNQYTVSNISKNTTVAVEFEAIPITTYTLSITATGNGSASFNGTTIRGKTTSFTVNEGTNATITFSPDTGYRIKSVKVNNSTVTVSNNQYTISNISKNTTVSVEFEAIPPTTYTLSITATGNGSASYNGTTVRGKTTSFTVNEGTNATITFTPDAGYRIASVKVNNATVSVSNNQYTVSNITANTTVAVTFEQIPPTYYDLTISATGNGSVTYNGTNVRGKSQTFSVVEGTNATITFTPDAGYRIASVKVNNSTVSVSNNQYTVSNITANTTVAVTFEQIPPTYYDLTITATGNGTAMYNSTNVRGKSQTFSVVEGTNATINFTPDAGYRIKTLKVNNSSVSISSNQYTVSNISKNTTVSVEFEAIPPTTYTLSITATGSGSASYNGTTVRGKTSTFTVNEGSNATITFTPDAGYRIASVKVNNATVSVSNNQYTVSNITANTTVAVTFEQIPPTYYDLTITATGNGTAMYNSTNVRGKSQTFSVVEGTNATITFTPDAGYRIKTLKVNNSSVSISSNQYTVSNISKNTTVSVEFEQIPPTTYTLSITATGNGSASYNGTTVRGKTSTFTVNEGANATVTFTPDAGYRIASVKVNNATVSVSNNQYTVSNITANTTIAVTFEQIPTTTYTLAITATGNGSASYNGTTIRGRTYRFNVNEGSNATITFSPDNSYRIKSLTVNGSNVSVSNNQYTITNISQDMTVAVEFEAIPPTTYTLSITATGSGSASYNGTTIRSKTSSFTVNEGTNATITFTPDNGYRIKSVKVNGITVSISNNQCTLGNINQDKTVEVEFEAIPFTTYTLSVTATGNGYALYNKTSVRGMTQTFTVNEGTNATVTFTPDNGYRIKSVKVNNSTVTVSNNQYTVSNIHQNTTVAVEFEAIPPTTYTLSVTAFGNGSASYNGTTVRGRTSSFTVNEGANATVTFTPDNGYRIKSVKVNGSTVTVSNNQYTISNININITVSVEFEAIPPTTYTLSITATGNGSASYNGTTIRGRTTSFTMNEGTNATITFTPDNGYRIKSVKVNNTTVSISSNQYTVSNISKNTTVAVEFEAIPITTYTLSVTATGNGYALYNKTSVRGMTQTFTVNEGTNATVSFTPDNGYRIKSVKVNNSTVTVSNNQYTVSNINRNTMVAVEFEAIPPTTYTLSITATGNGSASYNGTTVRGRTTSFTVNEGANATITFSPDTGYRIKTLKVNNTTVSISGNQYTVSSISKNTTVAVDFEAIPPTTYTLSITATGSGSASYNGANIRGMTQTFTVNEGTNATITFSPDNGYRIKSLKVNNSTVAVSNNQYIVSNIRQNTTVVVEFEAIPITTYTLSITATGSGSASYNGMTIRGKTTSFTVNEGTNATITFSPDTGYRIKSVKVNNSIVSISGNQYTVSNISRNTAVTVEFEAAITEMAVSGVSYRVVSLDNRTIRVTSGDYGQLLRVPTTVSYQGLTFTVVGIENGALTNAPAIAAVIWEPQAPFTESVSNPNLLLYVSRAEYAPAGIQNVVVDGTAERIVLTEAQNGNDFYCPEEFTARSISLTHQYGMTSGMGVCQGWETIVLPFEVQRVAHESKGTMVPFAAWGGTESEKPFWLYELGAGGWAETTTIRANVPYIISVPNHQNYRDSYRLPGHVTFSAENARVKRTDEAAAVSGGGRTLVPNFRQRAASNEVFALNVVNQFDADTDGAAEGSQFVRRLRQVHPFEAYMTATATTRGDVIPVFEDMAMHNSQCTMHNYESMMKGEGSIYTLDGRKLDGLPKKKGVYIYKGKKVIR